MKIEMKKIFTTLAALLIVSVGFAQLPANTKLLTPNEETPFSVKFQPRTMNKDAKMSGSFWYNYAEALNEYGYDGAIPLDFLSLFTDSMSTMPYANRSGRPQFYSVLQVFNLVSESWETFYTDYRVNGTHVEIPWLRHANPGANIAIDSVSVEVIYLRGTETPSSVVDTLVISVASAGDNYILYSSGSDPKFISYDNVTYDQDNVAMAANNSIFDRYEIFKIPLTEANANNEGTDNHNYNYTVGLTDFQNLTNAVLLVSYGMISGTPKSERDTNSIIGTELSHIRGLYRLDPRSEFANDTSGYMGSGWLQETNLTLQIGETLHDTASNYQRLFGGKYVPQIFYVGNAKRFLISALVSCSDCAGVSINDVTAKNITVRPNPATNNFTVELNNDSQAQVQLFNLVGQVVYNAQTNNQTVNVNISNLNSGVYMLKVTQNGRVYTSKVLVQ